MRDLMQQIDDIEVAVDDPILEDPDGLIMVDEVLEGDPEVKIERTKGGSIDILLDITEGIVTLVDDFGESNADLSVELNLAAVPNAGQVCLVQIHGPEMGRLYDIGPGGAEMGRGEGAEISIASDTVSRRHAKLVWLGETLTVNDLGSLNGTYLDDRRVTSPTPVHPGQMLRLGSVIYKTLQGADLERRYHEEIYRMAIFDGLTNIHNKRFFMEFLEREHQRAIRHKRPLSLLMIDVDHFKQANDEHGHINGDRLLRQVASRMRGFVRRDECFAALWRRNSE